MEEYLEALFDAEEFVCSADNPFETKVTKLEGVSRDDAYITLNPLRGESSRADKNTDKFRNFLVEFDDLILDKQLLHVEEIGMPFTTCVFSGNKSFHFVISLQDPLQDRKEYDRLVRWLYAAVPDADPSCKNPSRFTRLGGGTHKNGTKQDIEQLRGRVSQEELVAWLSSRCEQPACVSRSAKQLADDEFFAIQKTGYRAKLHKATIGFCKTGGRKGFRHKNVFIAACNMRDCYYTIDEAKFLLLNKLAKIYAEQGRSDEDLELKERAIEDAYQQVPRVQTRS